MMYYKYIDILVKAFGYDAKNILDVGSANTKYIEAFHWIPEKFTLDIKNPYKSPNVTAIETDFFDYHPNKKFDFVTCFQVLEHIPDVQPFAQKLFTMSNRVLLSVPYMWPENAEDEHVNDPIDEKKLYEWTGKRPSYSIIVTEPLRNPRKGISKRLISYYGPEGDSINFKHAIDNVRKLNKYELGHEKQLENLTTEVEENNQMFKGLQKDLNNILVNQKKYFELAKLKLEEFRLETNLKEKSILNQELEHQKNELKDEIRRYKSDMRKMEMDQQYYLKECNKILQSTSWKVMKPMRWVRSLFKKVLGKNR